MPILWSIQPTDSELEKFERESPNHQHLVLKTGQGYVPLKPNGPAKPDIFRWNLQTCDGLTVMEMKLLHFVWERREDPPNLIEVKKNLWPKSYHERGSYDPTANSINRKMKKIGCRLRVKNGYVVIQNI